MADKKLTDNQIVMLMERCYRKESAVIITQYNSDDTKTEITVDDILGVINRQREEIKKWSAGNAVLRDMADTRQAEIKRLETLAELGNMRANDYRVMRNRAIKAEAEIERLKEDVSFGQRTCKEWAETCDELTEKLNGAIAGQETLQKALAEKNAEIERLRLENEELINSRFGIELNTEKSHREWAGVRERAIEQFAERLKDKIGVNCDLVDVYEHIDNLVKEMAVRIR